MKKKFAEPEYVELFRKAHPTISHLAVERNILRNWKKEWSIKESGPYGLNWTGHFLEYCALMFPSIDHHPFFIRMVESFERTHYIEGRKIGNLIGSQNSGKCLAPWVKVRMADGSIKRNGDIVEGDELMGDDMTPRRVLKANSGRSNMVRIVPSRGEEWECNDDHILTLKSRHYGIFDISVKQYMGLSDYHKSHSLLIRKSFEDPDSEIDYDFFWIEQLGEGDWHGFTLDGNGRYLLADGTVTHNTDFFATFGMGLMSIWPEYTSIYVAAPFLTAAESTIWGRLLTRMSQMKDANKDLWKHVYYSKARNRITFYEGSETGSIELRTMDKVAKLQGTKSLAPDKGFLMVLCDEIALFPTQDLLELLQNLCGNANFFCYTGCNFKDVEGLEGKLCQPEAKEYSELDMDDDQEWLSRYRSMTFRFDGHLSPNVVANKVTYPYLLTESRREEMEDIHGKMGPKYLEQIRSFPNSQASDYYVTSRDKIRSGGGWDEFVFDQGIGTRVAFCDPGFGGDPCKIGVFEFSLAKVTDSAGEVHTTSLFMPIAPIETIKVQARMPMDNEWKSRLRSVASSEMLVQADTDVTIENQIAVQCGEFLQRWGVPRANFGFDGSMRAGIVTEMIKVLGGAIHAIDFGGKPTDRIGDLTGKKRANELYGNFVTEMYFNFASCIQAGQFRNANLVDAAIAQICRRKWEEKGDRKQIEPKKIYKKMNQGRSPDDADTMIGAFEMAVRKGFSTISRGRPSNLGGIMRVIENMRASEKFRPRTAKKLNPVS